MLCGDTVRHQLYSDFTAEQLALLGEGTIPVARLIINESMPPTRPPRTVSIPVVLVWGRILHTKK